MAKTRLIVEGMACQHCAGAVTKAVSALPGVAGVTVDLAAKTVTVEHDPGETGPDKIKSAIDGQGYEVLEHRAL